jgi:hypothetical protein
MWLFGSFVLWLAGKVVSGYNAKFTEALIISLLGTIINIGVSWVFGFFGFTDLIFGVIVPLVIVLIVYILLIMHFFDTGFLGALAVGILYFIFMIIIGIILLIIGVILLVLLLALFP